jgi:hypothetical protein
MIVLAIRLILTRISNTWVFMWQSFSVIRYYRSLTLLPIISWVFCVLISIIVLGSGALVFDIPIRTTNFAPAVPRVSVEAARELTLAAVDGLLGDPDIGETKVPTTPAERKTAEEVWLVLFFFYLANSCVIVYFNVAFAHIAVDRLTGGRATLDDGLKIAWTRKYSVFQWAVLAATVGILLKMVRDRSSIGKWIASILGYFWKLGTYFMMPLLAFENVSPAEALHRSAALIKERWGDIIIAGFSFPLLFFVLTIPGLVFFFLAGLFGQTLEFAALVAMAYWLFLAVIVFSAEQVFTTALYSYAKEDRVPRGFRRIDLKSAWEGLPPLPAGQAL